MADELKFPSFLPRGRFEERRVAFPLIARAKINGGKTSETGQRRGITITRANGTDFFRLALSARLLSPLNTARSARREARRMCAPRGRHSGTGFIEKQSGNSGE